MKETVLHHNSTRSIEGNKVVIETRRESYSYVFEDRTTQQPVIKDDKIVQRVICYTRERKFNKSGSLIYTKEHSRVVEYDSLEHMAKATGFKQNG